MSKIVSKLFSLAKNNSWNKLFDLFKNNPEYFDYINSPDDFGNYLIYYAILNNNSSAVKFFLDNDALIDILDNENHTLLYIPIKFGYNDILDLLLFYNKVNVGLSIVDIPDNSNNLPIYYAIINKNFYATKQLLLFNSDLYHKNNDGFNSLHLAVYSRSLDICRLIINSNIDINSRSNSGETALHIACNLNLFDISKFLIDNHADINLLDFDNEYSPLHYAITSNNFDIFSLLLKQSNINLNLQDFFGNSPLHYAIIEKNFKAIDLLISSNISSLNINLYNIDHKLPIHLIFDLELFNNILHFDFFVKHSLFNFQDNSGNTPLHFLCKFNLWSKYLPSLLSKKLDIFIKNNDNQRPIDFIDKNSFDSFINLIVDNYLFILRNNNVVWNHKWQNFCKSHLFYDKINDSDLKSLIDNLSLNSSSLKHDLCPVIIKKTLLKIYNDNSNDCNLSSYPLKKNKICISFPNTPSNIQQCNFIGSTIDILFGLLFLLKKHPSSCSTISSNFITNNKLQDYYQSIGLDINSNIEFFNFQIVWINNTLFFSDNFSSSFNKCLANSNKHFILIPLGIELSSANHANYLLFNIRTNELERFEPFGSSPPYNFNYNPSLLDYNLVSSFKKFIPSLVYFPPSSFLPRISFQYLESLDSNSSHIGDPSGFCSVWSVWYIDLRLTYFDINRSSLVNKMLKNIKKNNLSYKSLIRDYSFNISSLRDSVFSKFNLSINDWINERFTPQQFSSIISSISSLILSLP